MLYSIMKESDFNTIIPIYLDYYNNQEEGTWTIETAYKRIHQIWSIEDSYCLILKDKEKTIGFSIGYFEQYDDLKAYDLVEIVINHKYQNKGLGTEFMLEIERQVKELGASMIQLQAVNDEMHNNFYSKLIYKNVTNLTLKSKWLDFCNPKV